MKITRTYQQLWFHDDDGNRYNVCDLLYRLVNDTDGESNDEPVDPYADPVTVTVNLNGEPVN